MTTHSLSATTPCPHCDDQAHLIADPREIPYKGIKHSITVYYYRCDKCTLETTTYDTEDATHSQIPGFPIPTRKARELMAEFELLSSPGDTIQETLDAKGIDQLDFAASMGVTPEWVVALLFDGIPINDEIATKLEQVLGIDAQFWINRDDHYRQRLAELESRIDDLSSSPRVNSDNAWERIKPAINKEVFKQYKQNDPDHPPAL